MFFKNRSPRSTPPWVMWLVIGFVVFAVFSNAFKQTGVQQAAHNLAPDKLFHLEDYKKVFARGDTLNIKDEKPGHGSPVICGQKVSIVYSAFLENGKTVNDKTPLTFNAGSNETVPALSQAVFGMKKGGSRRIIAPPYLAYEKEFSRDDVPASSTVGFEITLTDASPELPDVNASPYRIMSIAPGQGPSINCGDSANMRVTIWSVEGKKIYAAPEPLAITPGKSEAAIGLEQGVLGMSPGGVRTLVLPPDFQKTLNGNAPSVSLPFPKNQTVLVDVEYAP